MAPGIAPPLLEVADLQVRFRGRAVVAGVGYSIRPGRTLGVVGESGCGKSMTALALMGLVPQPGVVNGASNLLAEVFGDRGAHARSAVGVSELPLDAPVEVELVVEVG